MEYKQSQNHLKILATLDSLEKWNRGEKKKTISKGSLKVQFFAYFKNKQWFMELCNSSFILLSSIPEAPYYCDHCPR